MTAMAADLRAKVRFVLAYAYITLRNMTAYRADLFIKLAGYPARLIMAYFLWRTLFDAGMVGGHGFSEVLTYYLITYFLTQMYPFVRMARQIREEIFSGDIAVFLARGIPHSAVWVGRFMATATTYVVLVAPVAALLIAALGDVPLNPQGLVGFFGLLVLGMVIKGQLWYLVGISAFYTEENMGTIRLFDLADKLLSGAVLPLFFFPEWLKNATQHLPFAYTLYSPVQTLLQPGSWLDILKALAIGLFWCLVLGLVNDRVFRGGWRRFTAHGA